MSTRLEFVKRCLYILVDSMHSGDMLSVCTYAGAVGTVLYPTSIDSKSKAGIKSIIADLTAGGSTAMASGLQNAYNVNMCAFVDGGVNRVVVCSDGDANVGATSHEAILALIGEYVDKGVTLSTLGFGQGNYNDYLMEQLADRGNGNYYYIDSEQEARRLFGEELIAMMEVVAKDVKVQVAFSSAAVERYRLIGYENRDIADDAFAQDTTDGGEIGAGHRVTALYEIELLADAGVALGTVHLRYKLPDGSADIPFDVPMSRDALCSATRRHYFTQSVSEYAEILRASPYVSTNLSEVEEQLRLYHDPSDDRDVELLELCRKVRGLVAGNL
jgi:Ca-activated chloride channel family protein